MTHYSPFLCERQRGMEKAVCGAWIDPRCDHSTEPTCPTCKAYLLAEPKTADEAAAEADRLFGTPDPSFEFGRS